MVKMMRTHRDDADVTHVVEDSGDTRSGWRGRMVAEESQLRDERFPGKKT